MGDKYAHLKPPRPRQCYREDGIPKIRYDSRADARRQARKWPGYGTYRCEECNYYHIGRKIKNSELKEIGL